MLGWAAGTLDRPRTGQGSGLTSSCVMIDVYHLFLLEHEDDQGAFTETITTLVDLRTSPVEAILLGQCEWKEE